MSLDESHHYRDPDAPEDSKYDDLLMEGHEYDGIKEYDNPIPPWLSLIFVGTIVWSLFYFVAINLGYIDRYEDSLEKGQMELSTMRRKAAAKTPEVDQAYLKEVAGETDRVAAGNEVYMNNCASCHGQKGEGLVGPNLTDKYWIHGGELKAVYDTIVDGVPDKGMPPWGPQLKQKQIVNTVAFIRSIHGTDPEGAKEAEGDPYEL